jgi:hypothetical protein
MMKQQEMQLKTPCRVLIENLKHNQTTSPNDSDLSSPVSVSVRNKKRVKRSAKRRAVQSDGETESVKKMSDEELKRMLTPLQVEIKLPRIGLTDSRINNSESRRSVKKRSLPTRTLLDMEFSDSDNDSDTDRDLTSARQKQKREKMTSETENVVPFPTVTVRNRPRKHRASPASSKSSSLLKVKIINFKGPRSTKKVTDASDQAESDRGKDGKKRALPLKKKPNDEEKTDKLEVESKSPKKSETEKVEKGTDASKDKQSSAPTEKEIDSNQVDETRDGEIEMSDNLTEEPAKPEEVSSGVSRDKPSEKPNKMRGPKSRRGLALLKSTGIAVPTEDQPPPCKSPKEQTPLVTEPAKLKKQTSLVMEPTKPKKLKPMPLSKKRLLGLVIDDDLIIDEETICSNVKTEMASPPVPSPSKNGSRSQGFMNSFLQRLSMEDPLEGTSRQHVYKKPQTQPSQTASAKKSLRHMEKKSYQESPLSDAAATDDDTWYPAKKAK